MTTYIHELKEWPRFRWNEGLAAKHLAPVRHRQGRLIGRMEALGFDLRAEAVLANAHRGCPQIQRDRRRDPGQGPGTLLDRAPARHGHRCVDPADRHVEGVVEMMLDATQNYAEPLTDERLFAWHAALFPTGRSGMTQDHRRRVARRRLRSDAGGLRSDRPRAGPLRSAGCAAPRSGDDRLSGVVQRRGRARPRAEGGIGTSVVRHHPSLRRRQRAHRARHRRHGARALGTKRRSASTACRRRSGWSATAYYDILEATQKGDLDVTRMVGVVSRLPRPCVRRRGGDAIRRPAQGALLGSDQGQPLNERQRNVINRLLDGFEGKLTSSKWAALTKCSHDTALRDITDLVKRGILVRDAGGGRSTSYSLAGVGSGERP